ncbi:hypothetical protein [Rhodococcus sp. IEGM1428]|uniref:hypothetical protein n=1 Tax=Rhodococcus sp. IEGM1428 TaxID=3392191 RepID=UPI003D124E1E
MTLTDEARDDIFFALSDAHAHTTASDPHFLLRLTLLLASDVGDRRLVLERIQQAHASAPHPATDTERHEHRQAR